MKTQLYEFLPAVMQPRGDGIFNDDGYARCLVAMSAVDDSIEQRVHSLYWGICDDDAVPRPLAPSAHRQATALIEACAEALSCFERLTPARPLRLPSLSAPPHERRQLLEWWIGGRAFTIARLKYLQGKCSLFENRIEETRQCCRDLQSAGLTFLQSGQPDVYMGGLEYCRCSLLLLQELIGLCPDSRAIARSAIEFSLSICQLDWFLGAFLAPQGRLVIDCIEGVSRGDPIVETLRRLSASFREQLDEDPWIRAASCGSLATPPCEDDVPLPSTILPLYRAALHRNDILPGKTAALAGAVSQVFVDTFGKPAAAAIEELEALADAPLSALGVEGAAEPYDDGKPETAASQNMAGRLLVGSYTYGMATWARVNAFEWYQPLAQTLRAAVSIAARAFVSEWSREPRDVDELVKEGFLPGNVKGLTVLYA